MLQKNKEFNTQNGSMIKVGIVFAKFNGDLGKILLEKTIKELQKQNVKDSNIKIFEVPGALEIPFAAKKIIKKYRVDVIIGIGVIIKGKTAHFEHVSRESIHGLQQVSLETMTPAITAIITANTRKQAEVRVKNNGPEYAHAALEMALKYD